MPLWHLRPEWLVGLIEKQDIGIAVLQVLQRLDFCLLTTA